MSQHHLVVSAALLGQLVRLGLSKASTVRFIEFSASPGRFHLALGLPWAARVQVEACPEAIEADETGIVLVARLPRGVEVGHAVPLLSSVVGVVADLAGTARRVIDDLPGARFDGRTLRYRLLPWSPAAEDLARGLGLGRDADSRLPVTIDAAGSLVIERARTGASLALAVAADP